MVDATFSVATDVVFCCQPGQCKQQVVHANAHSSKCVAHANSLWFDGDWNSARKNFKAFIVSYPKNHYFDKVKLVMDDFAKKNQRCQKDKKGSPMRLAMPWGKSQPVVSATERCVSWPVFILKVNSHMRLVEACVFSASFSLNCIPSTQQSLHI